MDPNHFHYQQAFFNYMQNYQNPNPQNSQIPPVPTNPAIFLPSPNNPNMYPIPQMNSNSMEFSTQVPPFSTKVPPFSTQVGTEKEERIVVKKRSREQFTREEDILLIQSWLNVSKDPIVGVDQKAESFWLRIAASYNQYRGQLREKLGGQLKCRWHRINGMVQKFVGCYKIALKGKKSGTSETDVMADAHAIFAQDQGTTFNLEYAWRLLKDEAKWRIVEESIGSSAKITETYASGASSENPDTTSSYEFNSSSPMERPMGQKAAKRKGKASKIPNATQDAKNKRAITMDRLAQAKEDELELRVVQMMMKDTSTMNGSQRDIHEKYCNKMKKNMECS
ncbi:glutathione S-transferase T3 [Lathyrus oleraceus]|uniref:glutathione S-transferase T3 n=1 Tax=Pisum sativum TaxID=3888 RepID=UPI0021D164ED|nr:glutathione S-transferase T3-like [Pisum sativum]